MFRPLTRRAGLRPVPCRLYATKAKSTVFDKPATAKATKTASKSTNATPSTHRSKKSTSMPSLKTLSSKITNPRKELSSVDLEYEEIDQSKVGDDLEEIPDMETYAARFYQKKSPPPKKTPQFEIPQLAKTPIEIQAESLENPRKKPVREYPYVNIVKKHPDGRTSHYLIGTTVPFGRIEVEGVEGASDVKHVVEVGTDEDWKKIMEKHDNANVTYSHNSGKEFNPAKLRDFDETDSAVEKMENKMELAPTSSYGGSQTRGPRPKIYDEDGDEDDAEDDDFSGRKKKVYIEGAYDIKLVVDVIKDMKGWDIVALDASNKANFIPYMVFATGRSGTHLRGIAQRLIKELKSRRKGSFKIDHKDNDFWVIVNSGIINDDDDEDDEDVEL